MSGFCFGWEFHPSIVATGGDGGRATSSLLWPALYPSLVHSFISALFLKELLIYRHCLVSLPTDLSCFSSVSHFLCVHVCQPCQSRQKRATSWNIISTVNAEAEHRCLTCLHRLGLENVPFASSFVSYCGVIIDTNLFFLFRFWKVVRVL